MMKFIAGEARDPSLAEMTWNYERSLSIIVLENEENRKEMEEILVKCAESVYNHSFLMQMYCEEAMFGIPDELPDLQLRLIHENLGKMAKTDRNLMRDFTETKDELSINEESRQEAIREAAERKRQIEMDENIKAIVDKEINDFFKPKSLLNQEIIDKQDNLGLNLALSVMSPRDKKSATVTMNTSTDNHSSIDPMVTFSSGLNSQRIESAIVTPFGELKLNEGSIQISAIPSFSKNTTRKQLSSLKLRPKQAGEDKWKIPLGHHDSICRSVRENAETTIQKKLGEIIIDSFKNDIETCRPLSE